MTHIFHEIYRPTVQWPQHLYHKFLIVYFFPHGSTALVGLGLLSEVPQSHSAALHSVWLLWMSDQPATVTSTWQHTTLTKDRHPLPSPLDSQTQSQQASSHRPMPYTAQPLGSAFNCIYSVIKQEITWCMIFICILKSCQLVYCTNCLTGIMIHKI